MSQIKICGLKRMEDIEAVNEYRPEYIGFVFANTRRFVSDETAAELKDALDSSIKAVGVFVNEPVEHMAKLVAEGTIDMVQLHGQEDLDYVNQLRAAVKGVPIIKAVRIDASLEVTKEREQEILRENQKLIDEAKALQVDYLLFDAKVKGILGGSGKNFDIAGLPSDEAIGMPYFLAGGIGLHNANELIQLRQPFGIDVSSAVETDGYKDREKIKEIIDAVRKESK
ncbi:MAG: phosphoribosylanthranilate isomerase [Lachnospiraceae bacterium]|nr:phosphoribosylanthranilate isomerase [Lachnospiraceae bacterium]